MRLRGGSPSWLLVDSQLDHCGGRNGGCADCSARSHRRGSCGQLGSVTSGRWGLTVECHWPMDTAYRQPHCAPRTPREDPLDTSWQLEGAGACLQDHPRWLAYLESSTPTSWTPDLINPCSPEARKAQACLPIVFFPVGRKI